MRQRKEKSGSTNTQTRLQEVGVSPGLDGQLRVEHTGGNPKLLQEQFESVTSVHGSHEHQRLALDQPQPQQRVDEQELVLLLTFEAVLLQLAAVGELRALKLQDHLRGHRGTDMSHKRERKVQDRWEAKQARVKVTGLCNSSSFSA